MLIRNIDDCVNLNLFLLITFFSVHEISNIASLRSRGIVFLSAKDTPGFVKIYHVVDVLPCDSSRLRNVSRNSNRTDSAADGV